MWIIQISDGKVYVSSEYANKFEIKEGDSVTLDEQYDDEIDERLH